MFYFMPVFKLITMESNSYYYCSQNKYWIPEYIYASHIQMCHNAKDCKRLHPIIADGFLIATIFLIKPEQSLTNSSYYQTTGSIISSENYIVCEDPGIMEKIGCTFYGKVAFFSESDLYCCRIEGFSFVLIEANNSQGIYIAVPCGTVQNGTVYLYEKGIHNLSLAAHTTMVSVKRIDSFKIASEVKLKAPASCDKFNSLIPKVFKRKFSCKYGYGVPLIFREKEHLCEMLASKKDNELSICVEKFEESPNYSHCEIAEMNQESFNRSSPLHNLWSPLNKSPVLSNPLESLDSPNVQNHNLSFKTSTPIKKATLSSSTFKGSHGKKKQRCKVKEDRCLDGSSHRSLTLSSFFCLSKESKIYMASPKSVLKQTENEQIPFYKDKTYDVFRDLLKKKMDHFYEGDTFQCPWNGILLSGLPGTGKTLLIMKLSADLNLPVITISILGWAASPVSNYIEHCFNLAKQQAPSILVVEEIDSLCHSNPDQENFSTKICTILNGLKNLSKPVIVIGTSNRPEAISISLKKSGRFNKEFILTLPHPEMRGEFLLHLLSTQRHNLTHEDLKIVGKQACGLSKADLDSLVKVAWLNGIKRWKKDKALNQETTPLFLDYSDFEDAINKIPPSFLRQKYSAISAVHWTDIFGYDDIKEKLKKIISTSTDGDQFSKGILLFGPPGCSKTMLVRALATETYFTYLPFKSSDLLSKFVGETEKQLCLLFKKASLSAPALIFMDEIDSLCSQRDSSGSETGIITELLLLFQKARKESNIIFIGATNRPQALDEVLLSVGIFEVLLHIDLPDCSARCSIWEGLLKCCPKSEEINIQRLCSRSTGLSCAEICLAYQNAANYLLTTLHFGDALLKEISISEDTLLKAIDSTEPRTPQSLLLAIESFKSRRKKHQEIK